MEREEDISRINCVSKLCLDIVSPRYLFLTRLLPGPFKEENLLLIMRSMQSLPKNPKHC